MSRFAALKASKYGDEFRSDTFAKCPHCGHEGDVNDNEWFQLYDEGDHDIECPACGEDFVVTSVAHFTFETDEQPDEDDDDLPAGEAKEGG